MHILKHVVALEFIYFLIILLQEFYRALEIFICVMIVIYIIMKRGLDEKEF